MTARFLIGFLGLCLVALVACADDDPARAPRETSFSGQLILVEDEAPLADVEVTLFEFVTHASLGRTVTDSAGRFEFTGLVPATVVPVVHSTLFRPVFLPQPRWRLETGDQVSVTLRLRRVTGTIFGTTDLTVQGRVLDASTLAPIPNARVEMTLPASGEVADTDWSEYGGWSNDLETTTDAEGRYELYPVPVLLDPVTGFPRSPDVRVVAPGYRAHRLAGVEDPSPGEILPGDVRLTAGADTGAIRGRVLDPRGEPMGGVPVSVEWRRIGAAPRDFAPAGPGFEDHLLIPGTDAWTDPEGRFEVSGLPGGFFSVLAGPYPDDGFVGVKLRGIEVRADDGPVEIELEGFVAVVAVEPADGAVLDDFPDRLTWESVPGAAGYTLRLTRAQDGSRLFPVTTDPAFEPSDWPEFFADPGSYAWEVLATDGTGTGISRTDRPLVFHVTGAGERR